MHVSPYGDASVPKIYDYIDGVNNKRNTDAAKWDFSKFQPDVVVINLGTNDNGYVGNNPERLEAFKQSYLDFLKRLRGYYPNAHIVCTMGMMTGTEIKLMDYLRQACEEFADSKCSILEFPMQNIAEDGAGCGHPSIKTHEKCAVLLTDHIKDKLNWQ